MKLLHIDSSILGQQSVSRQLTAQLIEAARQQHGDVNVTYRDLALAPVDHLAPPHLAAAQGAPIEAGTLQQDVALGANDLEAFLQADVVVIGAPMYNFSIPSQLKAWIDRIAIVDRTFRYTAQGPEGLAGGKRVLIASTRGGMYAGDAPGAAMDHHETYLTSLFGFLGVTDLHFIRAEGLAMGDDARAQALQHAQQDIDRVFA